MISSKLAPLLSLSTLTLGLFLAMAPRTAQAAEVMCSSDFGECTVSNDGQSFISCSCLQGGGEEGSGGDEFAGLSAEELNVICLEHLVWCEPQGDGDGDLGTSTSDSGDGDGDGDSGTSTSDSGDGDGDSGTTAGDSSTGDTANTSTGDSGDGDGDSGDGDGDSGDGDGDGDSGDGSGSDGGGSQGESGDGAGETGTGGNSGGAEGQADGGGCAVTTNASGFGLLMLSMLGLLGLRRRENG